MYLKATGLILRIMSILSETQHSKGKYPAVRE
jgi:hypothetical protein